MIADSDIVVFSDDWGRHPFSCMHLMQRFLPANRILWVNTIGMRYPRLTAYDIRRGLGKIKGWIGRNNCGARSTPNNLQIISPPMIPYNNIRTIRKWNCRSVVSHTKAAMDALQFRAPILLVTVPNAADYIGLLGERLSVYYCVDEFSEWPGVARDLVREMESSLVGKVDIVVAVSDALARSKRSPRGPAALLTHGVDLSHFRHQSCSCRGRVPGLPNLSGPVLGYFGLIDERTDQNLVEAILSRHPEWSVVFIGKSVVDLSRLAAHRNFHHVNAVRYEILPCYAASFTVCILPYVRTALTDNINPLKLKEYLATGKPVVSTALPEAVKLRSCGVRVGNGIDDTISRVEEVLAGDPWDAETQLSYLADETWESKAEQLSEFMADGLDKITSETA